MAWGLVCGGSNALAAHATQLFYDGFESGSLSPQWTVYSTQTGRCRIVQTLGPYEGLYHVVLDDALSDDEYSLNELVLTADLAGRTNVQLRFAHRNFFDESDAMPACFTNHYAADGVAVSSDGGTTWFKAQGLTAAERITPAYTLFTVDLQAIPVCPLVAAYKIKFQQYDNCSAAGAGLEEDGYGLDAVELLDLDTAHADLSVGVVTPTNRVTGGSLWPYTVRIENRGEYPAQGLVLSNSLPMAAPLYYATPPYTLPEGPDQVITWSLGDLSPGAATSVTVILQAPALATALTCNASVVSETFDTNQADNATQSVCTITPKNMASAGKVFCTLQCMTSQVPLAASATATFTYRLVVQPQSLPKTYLATNVAILGVLSNVTLSATASSLQLAHDYFYWPLGNLGCETSVVFHLRLTPQAAAPAALTLYVMADNAQNLGLLLPPDGGWWVVDQYQFVPVLDGMLDQRYVPAAYAGGFSQSAPILADLNADGLLDAVVGDRTAAGARCSWFRNLGQPGVPAWASPQALPASGAMARPVFHDLDQDGDLDRLDGTYSAGATNGRLAYYENTGDRTNAVWTLAATQYAGIVIQGTHMAPRFCDIDANGKAELFIGHKSGIWAYRNTGTVALAQWVRYNSNVAGSASWGLTNISPAFDDVDGDGDFDLLIGSMAEELKLCRNEGRTNSPNWTPLARAEVAGVGMRPLVGAAPALGDLDADGDLDLLCGSWEGITALFRNRGYKSLPSWQHETPFYLSWDEGQTRIPQFVDHDADGDLDLYLGGTLDFRQYQNHGGVLSPMWFANGALFGGDARYFRSPGFCDINGDGLVDLFLGETNGTITFYANTGSVTRARWGNAVSNYAGIIAGSYAQPCFCDLDNDGRPDLVVGREAQGMEPLLCYLNTGTTSAAAWTAPISNYFGQLQGSIGGRVRPCLADLNQDGTFDLLCNNTNPPGSLCLVENWGTPTAPAWAPVFSNFLGRAGPSPVYPACGDIDADGDADIFLGCDSGGLLFWRNELPHLSLVPSKLTLEAGTACDFACDPAAGAIAWRFILNQSGGTLCPTGGFYVAGTLAGLDIIEAQPSNGVPGRAVITVLQAQTNPSASRAVIVAGRNTDYEYDPVWLATAGLADTAYQLFRNGGYGRGDILYLSPGAARDVDLNGLLDDVDGDSSLANVRHALTNWVLGASNVFVYLTDHGATNDGGAYMRLNPSEVLAATELAAWMNQFQDLGGAQVTLVLDFCYAGSFLPALSYTGATARIVVAAAAGDQPSYFLARGQISFSAAFFNALQQGLSLGYAFTLARETMLDYQQACLDDNKDGLYEADTDGTNAAAGALWTAGVAGQAAGPGIGIIAEVQTLAGEDAAHLWAGGVSGPAPVDRVWCMVIPPGYNPDPARPIAALPEVDLAYNVASRRYEAYYRGFLQAGQYKLVYYAHDQNGGVSLPKYGYVNQAGAEELVLMGMGGTTNSPAWTNYAAVAEQAYATLLARQLNSNQVYWLGGSLCHPGMDGVFTEAAFSNALLAATNAAKLTVLLLGEASNACLRINETEWLSAAQLDAWLDTLQGDPIPVILLMDFDGAGGWLPHLTPPTLRSRTMMASAGAAETAAFQSGRGLNFSRYFFSRVLAGEAVWRAFVAARDGLFYMTHALQDAALDDDGDGVPNQKTDGVLAQQQYVGAAFVTGAELPVVGYVTPDQVLLAGQTSIWLYAGNIVAAEGLARVDCVVSPPAYLRTGAVESVPLAWNTGRYEVCYSGCTNPGTYCFTFYATDQRGQVSQPKQCRILTPDAYEEDDSVWDATSFELGDVQPHNFHRRGDEDWVRFLAATNWVVEIRTVHRSRTLDTVLDLYQEDIAGGLTHILQRDSRGAGLDAGEYILLDQWAGNRYCLRVRPYDPGQAALESEYDLQIYVPAAPGHNLLAIQAQDVYAPGRAPSQAVVYIEGPLSTNCTFPAGTNTMAISDVPAGLYTIRVAAPGYLPVQHPSKPGLVEQAGPYFGNPQQLYITETSQHFPSFQLEPLIEVAGCTRDAWSGVLLPGVALAFAPSTGTPALAFSYDGYPAYASYRQRWTTDAQGQFPTNVWLPPGQWTMTAACDGYTNASWAGGADTPRGTRCLSGTHLLAPIDTDADALPDFWSHVHFKPPRLLSRWEDDDQDGVCNWQEYLAGTHPNDAQSFLGLQATSESASPEAWVFLWHGMPRHAYQISCATNLLAGPWSPVAGPWTNWAGETHCWTNTAGAEAAGHFRIEEFRP